MAKHVTSRSSAGAKKSGPGSSDAANSDIRAQALVLEDDDGGQAVVVALARAWAAG